MSKRESKKSLIHKGMMDRARCYVGRHGVTGRVKKRFDTAFYGTPIKPMITDVVKVKIQSGFNGCMDRVIADLCAVGRGAEYIWKYKNFLFFYRAMDGEEADGYEDTF